MATNTATDIEAGLPASAQTVSGRQRTFVRYFTGILIDLVVLNLFSEYWAWVKVDSFTISLLAAVLLQVLLKLTIWLEHLYAGLFKGKKGVLITFIKFFGAWVILFGSKFVILEAVVFAFGTKVHFSGPWHGVIALIVVVVVMLLVEELIVRFVRRLG